MKPATEPVRTSRTRKNAESPATLGRSAPKDPAREQARAKARSQGISPLRSSMPMSQKTEGSNAPHKPSRASRSMKSRQSEPRRSKSGQNKSGDKRKGNSRQLVKPPMILMSMAAVMIAFGLILLPKVFQGSSLRSPGQSASEVRVSVSNSARDVAPDAQANRATTITARTRKSDQLAMNLTPVNQIQLGQIVAFRQGIPPVIEFRDGSLLNVDPVTLEQLPPDVRLQLTYTRERQ
jgi:hypothetical protein